MAKRLRFQENTSIIWVDSITHTLKMDHQKPVVICGSHGGLSSVKYALCACVKGVIFNDAGRGKANAGIAGYFNCFCQGNWASSNVFYCDLVMDVEDCFGCVNLKRNKNCILNKQYSEGEYKKLALKVIEHMKETGEWGEFFPLSL